MKLSRREFLGTAAAAAAMTSACAQPREAEQDANTAKYKAAIIAEGRGNGYGHHHHLAFANRPDVAVVALADPYDDVREERAAEAQAGRVYSDYREMLEKERPDLVSIAPRHTDKRVEHMLACAEFGCHGYIEKPFCADLAEAERIVAAMDAKGLKWVIAHNFTATPIVRHAKRLLFEEGLIGEVMEMRGRGKEDRRAGGEDMIVLGTHVFDLMGYFTGPPEWCTADFTVQGSPATPEDVHEATEPIGPIVGDRMQATYRYPGGFYGYFGSMRNEHGDGGRWGLDIYGSQGIATVRMTVIPTIQYTNDRSWAPGIRGSAWHTLPDAPETVFAEPQIDRHTLLIDELIAAVEEDRQPEWSIQQSGRGTVAMIQAAWESCVQGGPVSMPLEALDHPLKRWNANAGTPAG